MRNEEYKNCPYCDEEIKVKAIKCKHCQSMLDEKSEYTSCVSEQRPDNRVVTVEENKATNAGETLSKTGKSLTTIGCFLTVFVTIPILLLFFFRRLLIPVLRSFHKPVKGVLIVKILVVLIFVVVLFGCSAEDRQRNDTETTTEIEENAEQDENLEIGEAVKVEKGLFDVTVTLPASLFEPEELEDLIENAKQHGVKKVEVNEDGSVSYKMSKSDHSKMMDEIREGFIESLEDMVGSGDYNSLKDINYNKDFTNIRLIVDKEAFENSFDFFAIFGVGIMAMYYQSLDGVKPDNIRVVIDVEDIGTGEIYKTVVYPDAFDDE